MKDTASGFTFCNAMKLRLRWSTTVTLSHQIQQFNAIMLLRSSCPVYWFGDLTAVSQRCKILATSMKAEMAVFKVAAREGAVRSSLQLLADDTANVCQS